MLFKLENENQNLTKKRKHMGSNESVAMRFSTKTYIKNFRLGKNCYMRELQERRPVLPPRKSCDTVISGVDS